jgi:hypothetical protein
MKPLKSFVPLAKTLLRITAAILIGALYFDRLTNPDLTSVYWFISVVIVIFSGLLLIGGFLKSASLTVVSGLIICILSIIMMFMHGIDIDALVTHIAPAAIGFYFLARGNRG